MLPHFFCSLQNRQIGPWSRALTRRVEKDVLNFLAVFDAIVALDDQFSGWSFSHPAENKRFCHLLLRSLATAHRGKDRRDDVGAGVTRALRMLKG